MVKPNFGPNQYLLFASQAEDREQMDVTMSSLGRGKRQKALRIKWVRNLRKALRNGDARSLASNNRWSTMNYLSQLVEER